jgi:hypothetical protein
MLRLGPHQMIGPRTAYRKIEEMPLAGEGVPWAPMRRQLPATGK